MSPIRLKELQKRPSSSVTLSCPTLADSWGGFGVGGGHSLSARAWLLAQLTGVNSTMTTRLSGRISPPGAWSWRSPAPRGPWTPRERLSEQGLSEVKTASQGPPPNPLTFSFRASTCDRYDRCGFSEEYQ